MKQKLSWKTQFVIYPLNFSLRQYLESTFIFDGLRETEAVRVGLSLSIISIPIGLKSNVGDWSSQNLMTLKIFMQSFLGFLLIIGLFSKVLEGEHGVKIRSRVKPSRRVFPGLVGWNFIYSFIDGNKKPFPRTFVLFHCFASMLLVFLSMFS